MIEQEITEDLNNWIRDFVEKPNPLLNGWAPCPYARQARISNSIEIVFSDPQQLISSVERGLLFLESKDVVIICFDHTAISADEVEEMVKIHNYALMPRDYVILEDHPDAEEILNGVKMNFGKCGLLLVQKLSKLNAASDQLREKGYYDTWPDENLDAVVNWRDK
jgi:hypothetical protein